MDKFNVNFATNYPLQKSVADIKKNNIYVIRCKSVIEFSNGIIRC